MRLPVRLGLGLVTISIDTGPAEDIDSRSLKTIASPSMLKNLAVTGQTLLSSSETPNPETLAYWFEQIIAVQRAAAGSPEFYHQTARALVDVVGLDRGLVMLRRNNAWEPVARVCAQDDHCAWISARPFCAA
jgi:adenylate cyclase